MTTERLDIIAALAALPVAERRDVVRSLPLAMRRELADRWAGGWARAGQVAPEGDWRIWLIRAGRGFGKTRAGAEWVTALAAADKAAQIALVGATAADVRRVMIEGPSGLRAVAKTGQTPRFTVSRGEIRWPNGAVARVYSADVPDQLRGPEHSAAWCDELAKWRRGDAAWDNLMMGLRRGAHPRVLVTTTPRPTNLVKRVLRTAGLVETRGRTRDNPFLPEAFVADVEESYGGTALGRQELDGEMIEDLTGALWSRALLERCRGAVPEAPVRVVVGVDPPAGSVTGEGAGDACGIVAVGLDGEGIGHVLEDASVAATSPEGWARAVTRCAAQHRADRVIAEANQGGAMVRSMLLAADVTLPVTLVHASRGKAARAEPVATLYERGRVRHCGRFAALEDEMCGLVAGGGYHGPGRSPDRADALVWALSELMLGRRGAAGVRGL